MKTYICELQTVCEVVMFKCQADDKDHAWEQAENAYPLSTALRLYQNADDHEDLVRSALSALRDIDAGYPMRELHVDVPMLIQQAQDLGIDLEDDHETD